MRLRSHRGDRVHGEQHAADRRIRVAAHQADGVPRFGPAGLVAGVERSDDLAQAGHGGHRSPLSRAGDRPGGRWAVGAVPARSAAARRLGAVAADGAVAAGNNRANTSPGPARATTKRDLPRPTPSTEPAPARRRASARSVTGGDRLRLGGASPRALVGHLYGDADSRKAT